MAWEVVHRLLDLAEVSGKDQLVSDMAKVDNRPQALVQLAWGFLHCLASSTSLWLLGFPVYRATIIQIV